MKLKIIALGIAVALTAAPGYARAAGMAGGAGHGGGFAQGGGFAHSGPPGVTSGAGVSQFPHYGSYAHNGATAQMHNGHGDHVRGGTRRFADPAMAERWRGGHWDHDRHDGRLGWWWIVDGDWYYYQAPGYWYYCTDPAGYYPDVQQCGTAWEQVPDSTQPPG